MSEAGKRLIAAAKEARRIARGDLEAAKIHVPADIDVRSIRAKTKLSQDDFARQYGFTINQVRDWEQKRARPLGGVRAYLMLIDDDPDGIRRMLVASKTKKAA